MRYKYHTFQSCNFYKIIAYYLYDKKIKESLEIMRVMKGDIVNARESKERQIKYVPAVSISQITARHMMGRVLVARENDPECICGVARRIGYTGTRERDLAIYRLKVKEHASDNATTLPLLYVVDDGLFVDYDMWRQQREPVQD